MKLSIASVKKENTILHPLQLEKVLVHHLTPIPSYERIHCLRDFILSSESESIITVSYTNPFFSVRKSKFTFLLQTSFNIPRSKENGKRNKQSRNKSIIGDQPTFNFTLYIILYL